MQPWMIPWLFVAVPMIGTVVALSWWSSLPRLKTAVLATTLVSLASTMALGWDLAEPAAAGPLLCLLPLTAFLSLLGQPVHPQNRPAWITTPILLGMGLGSLSASAPIRDVLLIGLFGLLCGMLSRERQAQTAEVWRGLAAYGGGLLALLLSLFLPDGTSAIAVLVACATLLPLMPLHGGFLAVLTGLPGNLPAFSALLLPVLGFHRLMDLLPDLAGTTLHTVAILALVGAAYGSLRASIQIRMLPRLAFAGLAFYSLLWWYVGGVRMAPVGTVVYVSAVGLALSGLLLAWYALRARYGDIDLRSLGGLAYPMPRFSTLVSLLALAALGMPPFGVFSGFLEMLLHPAFTPSWGMAVVLVVWFGASWYLVDLLQQLVFGRQRAAVRHEDLRGTELVPLLVMLLLLLALGVTPSTPLQSGPTDSPNTVASKGAAWNP